MATITSEPVETDIRPLGEILTEATEKAVEAYGDDVCGATVTDARDVLTVEEAAHYPEVHRYIGIPLGAYVLLSDEYMSDDSIEVVREWARDYAGDYDGTFI